MSKFSEKLKQLRKDNGLSVNDVIEKLNARGVEIGVKAFYHWEAGRRMPDADEFIYLCEIYGVESFSVFDEETEKAPAPEEAEADGYEAILSGLTNMLQRMGWIREDGDISLEDKRFLLAVASMLNTYFEEHR